MEWWRLPINRQFYLRCFLTTAYNRLTARRRYTLQWQNFIKCDISQSRSKDRTHYQDINNHSSGRLPFDISVVCSFWLYERSIWAPLNLPALPIFVTPASYCMLSGYQSWKHHTTVVFSLSITHPSIWLWYFL